MDKKTALKQLKTIRNHPSIKSMRLAAESWKSDFEILVSTIMSARTRDEVTIPVAAKLFKKFPSAKKLSKAKISEIRKIIRPVNFYKNKSKNILACSKLLASPSYNGKIPHEIDELVKLPGVGRKTANVFLAELGNAAIGVDTHVSYISQKLGWTKNSKQEKIEHDLKSLFPKNKWQEVNSTLVRFGKTHTSKKNKDALLGQIKKLK